MHRKSNNLVLLPGWGFHASVFDVMLPHFSEYNIHCVELPALNRSASTTFDALAQSLPPHAVIAGWSLGGLIAIELCSRYPQQFTSLILLGSTPKFVAADDWNGISTQNAHEFLNQASINIHVLINSFHKLIGMPSHTIRKYIKTHARNDANLIHQLNYLFSADLRTQYFNLRQPFLLLAGEHDAILPASASAEIIKDAGHAFPFTHHSIVCKRMRDFMEQPT